MITLAAILQSPNLQVRTKRATTPVRFVMISIVNNVFNFPKANMIVSFGPENC